MVPRSSQAGWQQSVPGDPSERKTLCWHSSTNSRLLDLAGYSAATVLCFIYFCLVPPPYLASRGLHPPQRPEHDVQLRQSVRLSHSHALPLLDTHKHRSLLRQQPQGKARLGVRGDGYPLVIRLYQVRLGDAPVAWLSTKQYNLRSLYRQQPSPPGWWPPWWRHSPWTWRQEKRRQNEELFSKTEQTRMFTRPVITFMNIYLA